MFVTDKKVCGDKIVIAFKVEINTFSLHENSQCCRKFQCFFNGFTVEKSKCGAVILN